MGYHAIVSADTAYGAWRDAGLVMLDVADRAAPKLMTHRNWSPPFGGGTHNCLPLPDQEGQSGQHRDLPYAE